MGLNTPGICVKQILVFRLVETILCGSPITLRPVQFTTGSYTSILVPGVLYLFPV